MWMRLCNSWRGGAYGETGRDRQNVVCMHMKEGEGVEAEKGERERETVRARMWVSVCVWERESECVCVKKEAESVNGELSDFLPFEVLHGIKTTVLYAFHIGS